MKYLPLRDFETVTSALNFDTNDCHIIGACDLYTTKAAGNDRKLYKDIETSLEAQHESLIRLSASLSPPNAELLSLDLSRSSPFGPLSQVSSRRTFAYIVATLNASHPDYDFSQILKPADFSKENNLRHVMNVIDNRLENLRPPARGTMGMPTGWLTSTSASAPAASGGGVQGWGPRTWKTIDKEMSLRDCEIYCYSPDDDPFDGEESALWSMHYFFFNRTRKRVCYIHLRGFSIASHSPVLQFSTAGGSRPASMKRSRPINQTRTLSEMGSKKRARYWLGDKATNYIASSWDVDDSDFFDISNFFDDMPDDDEVDADSALGGMSDDDFSSSVGFSDSEGEGEYHEPALANSRSATGSTKRRNKGPVKDMNDHIAETMEV